MGPHPARLEPGSEADAHSRLNKLIETPDGFDYTGDCRGWMEAAGFQQTRVEPLVGPDSMVTGSK